MDLNPVRAAIAETPEESDYTSLQRRIHSLQAVSEASAEASRGMEGESPTAPTQPPELYPFVGSAREGGGHRRARGIRTWRLLFPS